MKKIMMFVLVLGVSALYSYHASAAAKNSVTLDADLGSIIGASATGNFGWPVHLGAGAGYDFVGEGGTVFLNAQYPVELTKTTLLDAGTLYWKF